jgi:iron complex outermembrane receptor protein
MTKTSMVPLGTSTSVVSLTLTSTIISLLAVQPGYAQEASLPCDPEVSVCPPVAAEADLALPTIKIEASAPVVKNSNKKKPAVANVPTPAETVELSASPSAKASPQPAYSVTETSTATGTTTPLRQTPQSVQVVTGDLLRDQNSRNISEALNNVSSAQAGNPMQTPAYDGTVLRGFSGEQMLDGMSTYYNAGDPNAMNNVERIEVLKGPNALLFGGGAGTPVGGVVNVVSKMPTDTEITELGLTVGSNGLVSPNFDINRPLNSNGSALFRFTGSYSTGGADVDVVNIKRYSLNPTLVLGAKGPTTLTLQGRFSHWESPEYQGLPAVGTVMGGFIIDPDLFIGDATVPPSFSKANSLTATLDHEFNDTWSNKTKLRLGNSDFRENVQLIFGNAPDLTPSIWALYNTELFQKQRELSLTSHFEGDFSSGNATHKLFLGVDVSRVNDEGAMLVDFTPLGPVDLDNPIGWPPFVAGAGLPMSDGDNTYITSGAFVQVQSTFNERLHLLGGLRLANLEIDNFSPSLSRSDKTSSTKLLPRLGVVYDVSLGMSVFASYSEGMKGNPFAFYTGTPQPETSQQAEIGIKFGQGGALSGSLSAFQIERKNTLVADPLTNGLTSIPVGEQQSRGVELDLAWQPTDQWKVTANYSVVEAELTKDIPFGAVAGTPLPFVPRQSGGIWVNYDLTDNQGDGWSFGAGLHGKSHTYIGTGSTYVVPGNVTADLGVSYKQNGLSANLSVKNVFDRDYYTAYKYLDGRVAKGDGRTIQISLTKRF